MSESQPIVIPAEHGSASSAAVSPHVGGTRSLPNVNAAHWQWMVLLIVFTMSATYEGNLLKRGWVPHDEGSFAHAAERVLAGELPHRDFDDVYTGGLGYVHALAFRIWGVNLASIRYALYFFFLLWVPAVFFIARRFVSPIAAGAVTLLAVAWSLPNYSAAVPSWYNLFLATLGIAFLFQYLESNSRWFLALAGACGGLSVVVKVSGLYYVAGVLLFLLYREQTTSSKMQAHQHRVYRWMVMAAIGLFVAVLAGLIRKNIGVEQAVYFLLPGTVLSVMLLVREWRMENGSDRERLSNLLHLVLPFAGGAALPLVAFLVPYIISGSVHALWNGIFVLPARRLLYAAMAPPPLYSMLAVLPIALLIIGTAYRPKVFGKLTIAGAVLSAGMILIGSSQGGWPYWLAWHSAYSLIPIVVLIGAAILAAKGLRIGAAALQDQRLMILLSVAAMCSLVQFPFSAPIYFCYVAPLLLLAVVSLLSYVQVPKVLAVLLIAFYLLFAVMRTVPGFIYAIGHFYTPDYQIESLSTPRGGGIRVAPAEAAEYDNLISILKQHSTSEFIYAAPDCPEVYFLSGLKNPTRTLVDFLDDPEGRIEGILGAIERNKISVIAINNRPAFSSWIDPKLRAALVERFPNFESVGRFQVRWR